MPQWTETTSSVAAEAGCEPSLVRAYTREGLIPSYQLPNGTRLYRRDAANRVRKIKAERLSRRGRYPRPSAAV
jgi:DNA-binding transcriptional MerR regulator